jgi:hypothetical protein
MRSRDPQIQYPVCSFPRNLSLCAVDTGAGGTIPRQILSLQVLVEAPNFSRRGMRLEAEWNVNVNMDDFEFVTEAGASRLAAAC